MLRKFYGISKEIQEKGYDGFMDKFPILFKDRNLGMNKTCLCWGIECPIGWYNILEQLCTVLEFYNIEYVKKYNMGIVAEQVKEKFGTLRFYYSIVDMDENGNVIYDNPKVKSEGEREVIYKYLDMLASSIISEADGLTYETCAKCGVPLTDKNRVETSDWISYVCKGCNDKRNVELNTDYFV